MGMLLSVFEAKNYPKAGLPRHFGQVVGNGADMAIGVAGADDHGVRDAGFAAYIQGDDVAAFHVIDLVDDKGEQFLALQCLLLSSGARGRRIISWSLPFPSLAKGNG